MDRPAVQVIRRPVAMISLRMNVHQRDGKQPEGEPYWK
jgi:hypothetical protein